MERAPVPVSTFAATSAQAWWEQWIAREIAQATLCLRGRGSTSKTEPN